MFKTNRYQALRCFSSTNYIGSHPFFETSLNGPGYRGFGVGFY